MNQKLSSFVKKASLAPLKMKEEMWTIICRNETAYEVLHGDFLCMREAPES